MTPRRKIFNDPVYGFISVPHGLLLQLVDHPYFQRLRRIRQTGLAHYVYPGALHTRFHHALGALHLMQQAVEVLRYKGVQISAEECEAVCAAILLHDIGHGPYSHALEHTIVNAHHEDLSIRFMEAINRDMNGALDLAIAIFTDQYHKKFLHQLVSGQLDMDRMDYLSRDSFFTGVSEGVIGYDRLIKMLDVHDGELVVEEKGIYSIENFLIARRLMYWQVYLHKTNVSAEQMLIHTLRRARQLVTNGVALEASRDLNWFMQLPADAQVEPDELLRRFARLDDTDIAAALKAWCDADDFTLRHLAYGLLNRRLFKLEWHTEPIQKDYLEQLEARVKTAFPEVSDTSYFIVQGKEQNQVYNPVKEKIRILFKDNGVKPLEECSDVPLYTQLIVKYYVCYPKNLKH